MVEVSNKHVNSCDIDETAYYQSQLEDMKAELDDLHMAEEETKVAIA